MGLTLIALDLVALFTLRRHAMRGVDTGIILNLIVAPGGQAKGSSRRATVIDGWFVFLSLVLCLLRRSAREAMERRGSASDRDSTG
jgi:hypothetical protein